MKRATAIGVVVIGALLHAASPVDAGAQPPLPSHTVTGRLAALSVAPRCGDEHTAAVARIELPSADGRAGRAVYVVLDCLGAPGLPRLPRVGDVLRLELVPIPAGFEAAITDDFGSAPRRWLAAHGALVHAAP